MARETIDAKGRRYLGEGRLVVEHVVADEIRARCRGGGAEYALGLEAGEWFCSCPARGRCAHLIALGLVTVAPDDPEPRLSRPKLSHHEQPSPVRAGFE